MEKKVLYIAEKIRENIYMSEEKKGTLNRGAILFGIIGIAIVGILFYTFSSDDIEENEIATEKVNTTTKKANTKGLSVADSVIQTLAPADFKDFINENEDVVVIDVHIPEQTHISENDLFIPYNTIAESDELPVDKDTPIALYCRSGSMSAVAAQDLADLGYTNIADLKGGINAWNVAF